MRRKERRRKEGRRKERKRGKKRKERRRKERIIKARRRTWERRRLPKYLPLESIVTSGRRREGSPCVYCLSTPYLAHRLFTRPFYVYASSVWYWMMGHWFFCTKGWSSSCFYFLYYLRLRGVYDFQEYL